jgi:hypothetical protein
VQRERFPSEEEYQRVKNSYRVDNASLKHAKSSMIVMHPLPRNEEVAEEVDFDQRAAYFRQVRTPLTLPKTRLLTFCRCAMASTAAWLCWLWLWLSRGRDIKSFMICSKDCI